MSRERPEDLMCLPPPSAPYFDAARQARVLSRYADVTAALHDPRLEPLPDGRGSVESHFRATIRERPDWQSELALLADQIASGLPHNRAIDVLKEFAEPWCATLACRVAGGAGQTTPAFVALAHTLPAFLAKAWLALLRHPKEFSRLRDNPDLLPMAVEELFRYAGLASSMFRVATADGDLGAAKVVKGQRVVLMLNSANRDPAQFPDPNRLDVTRRAAGHVSFGAGAHSCVAASLIRMAVATATSAFIRYFPTARVQEPVSWRGGAGFRAPADLYTTITPPQVVELPACACTPGSGTATSDRP
jgi:cytochrome P450